MPLIIVDKCLGLDGRPYGSPSVPQFVQLLVAGGAPFTKEPAPGTLLHPGEGGAAAIRMRRDASFRLGLAWPSELDLGVEEGFLVVGIALPDGSLYSGVTPEGITGPLTLHDLWRLWGWSGPRGPGRWPQPYASQLFGMLMFDGPGVGATPFVAPPYEQQHLYGFISL